MYTNKQLLKLIDSFNKKSFKEKLILIRENKEILKLEYDNDWSRVSFHGVDEDREEELQKFNWFEWESDGMFNRNSNIYDVFELLGIIIH